MTEPTKPTEEVKTVVWSPKPGMYKNLRGQAIIKADGNKMKQTNGYFIPVTQEEKDLCKYFEARGNLQAVK